jgi:mannobiose 2-epimerase
MAYFPLLNKTSHVKMLLEEPVQILPGYRSELQSELTEILEYWKNHTIDNLNGGFFGSIDNRNNVDTQAPKGVVLNSRILWTFSAAYSLLKKDEYLEIAQRAFQYIVDHFIDRKYGGVYWSVDSVGSPLDTRKQIYGLAFCIYGLTEYSKATGERIPLHLAKDLFLKIEQYSFDKEYGGYLEAFTQGWKPVDDLRLSEKDDNEKKTMNTHLHLIEAYANLSSVCPDPRIKEKIRHLLQVFDKYIINKQHHHLNLFMDEKWDVKSSMISYGHDIEAAWLLQECAELIDVESLIHRYRQLALSLSEAAAEGLANDGGLWYEYEPLNDHLIKEKHSWPQAEAMIGFFNAYELTKEERYLDYSMNCWQFVKHHIKDKNHGEWFWGVDENSAAMPKEKAGFWKCPYHNSRACMELINRISKTEEQ